LVLEVSEGNTRGVRRKKITKAKNKKRKAKKQANDHSSDEEVEVDSRVYESWLGKILNEADGAHREAGVVLKSELPVPYRILGPGRNIVPKELKQERMNVFVDERNVITSINWG